LVHAGLPSIVIVSTGASFLFIVNIASGRWDRISSEPSPTVSGSSSSRPTNYREQRTDGGLLPVERFAGLCNALEKLKTQNSKLVAVPNDGNLMCVKIIVPSPHFNKPFFQLGRWRALKKSIGKRRAQICWKIWLYGYTKLVHICSRNVFSICYWEDSKLQNFLVMLGIKWRLHNSQ